jgi:ribosomal protein L21
MSSAIFRTGGQQYRVSAGDVLRLATIAGEAGQDVVFDQVLAVLGTSSSDVTTLGQPLVSGAKVTAQIVRQDHGHFRLNPIWVVAGAAENDCAVSRLTLFQTRLPERSEWHTKKAAAPHATVVAPTRSFEA